MKSADNALPNDISKFLSQDHYATGMQSDFTLCLITFSVYYCIVYRFPRQSTVGSNHIHYAWYLSVYLPVTVQLEVFSFRYFHSF